MIATTPIGSSDASNSISHATTRGWYRFACSSNVLMSRLAAMPKSVISSVWEAMTSSDCLPMEPVHPSTEICFFIFYLMRQSVKSAALCSKCSYNFV